MRFSGISCTVSEVEARKAAEALPEDSVATKGDIANLQRALAVVKWILDIGYCYRRSDNVITALAKPVLSTVCRLGS